MAGLAGDLLRLGQFEITHAPAALPHDALDVRVIAPLLGAAVGVQGDEDVGGGAGIDGVADL